MVLKDPVPLVEELIDWYRVHLDLPVAVARAGCGALDEGLEGKSDVFQEPASIEDALPLQLCSGLTFAPGIFQGLLRITQLGDLIT